MRMPDGGSRLTAWLIGVSIALNLFFAAFLGAQAWRAHHRGPEADIAGERGGAFAQGIIRQLAEKLPPADARLLRNSFLTRLPAILAAQAQALDGLERLRSDIAQEPLDMDKVRADMQPIQDGRQKSRAVVEEVLVEILPRLSPQGRQALSQYRFAPRH